MDSGRLLDAGRSIEAALEQAVSAAAAGSPPRLGGALRHAVFPGGARVRPRLALAVAAACGDRGGKLPLACACAIELIHCASLVHDDLPCFDDAPTRRGRPSVHACFGAPVALLAGDALIVLAFETLARAAAAAPVLLAPVLGAIARGAGAPFGIAAGQAWESEDSLDPERYRASKTGALFIAACTGGALAAGGDPRPWHELGRLLGAAYQVADDLMDAAGGEGAEPEGCGKPLGQDARLGRPNAVAERGLAGAVQLLRDLVAAAIAAVPPGPGAAELQELVRLQALRLAPKNLIRSAA